MFRCVLGFYDMTWTVPEHVNLACHCTLQGAVSTKNLISTCINKWTVAVFQGYFVECILMTTDHVNLISNTGPCGVVCHQNLKILQLYQGLSHICQGHSIYWPLSLNQLCFVLSIMFQKKIYSLQNTWYLTCMISLTYDAIHSLGTWETVPTLGKVPMCLSLAVACVAA